jgi:DNA-binding beta-propeller fold protein YncE
MGILFQEGTSIVKSFLFCLFLCPALAAAQAALPQLTADIAMPGVKGRIDHFGADPKRHRLLVAALGNDTVEVLDLNARKRERSLDGFGEPQGILHVPETNRVFVANSSANRLDILDAESLVLVGHVTGLEDADNVRYDARARKVYVGYGRGALRVLDATTGAPAGDIELPGHPESFQLERNGTRIFVNVPTAGRISVIDRAKQAVVGGWSVPAAANFPMALDEAGRRLFVGARAPAVLLVYDTDTGRVVAKQAIGGDTDDLFFDPARKRIYVVCGEGRIDVVRQDDPDHYALEGTVKTAARARTGYYVPEDGALYVAAPASGSSPARVLAYKVR